MPALLPLLLFLAMRGTVAAKRGLAIVEKGRDIRDLVWDDSRQLEAISLREKK